MHDPHPRDHPFATDETRTVGLSGRPALRLPVRVALDGDTVTVDEVTDCPQWPAVSFVLFTESLDDELVRELTERLSAIRRLRPAATTPDRHNNIEVAVIAPDLVTDDAVSWAVTDSLAVVHADRAEAYFTCPVYPGQVALTAAQAWRLVQALASLDWWQGWLQGRFAASATSARRALRHRPHVPAHTVDQPPTGAR